MGVAMTITELANRELDILTGQLAYLKLSISNNNSDADNEGNGRYDRSPH
jgi:hypothetical protein